MNDQSRYEPVAVVGMAGRFPGAVDLGAFWANLRDGVGSIRPASDEELAAAGVPARALADPQYVKAVATVPEIDGFDAGFFGLTPREARICDPQIRLFLECAHAALEDAGYDPERLADVGVFGSAGRGRYLDLVRRSEGRAGNGGSGGDGVGLSLSTWNSTDSLAPLVSYKLGLNGPSLGIATACASPLVALHLAAASLRAGECELALVGGAEVELPLEHGYWWEPGGKISRDGHCRPFDAHATGTVFGSGAGVVALKRLSDAIADRDHIRAVIRGSAVNNDGSAKAGFAAPSVSGQSAAIAEAMLTAEVEPGDVGLVEAHASGTVLGDPIEVAALTSAYRYLGATGSGATVLTSVKGNIGHLGHASGIASLIKVVLTLEHGSVPRTLGFRTANPELGIDDSPFELPTAAVPWERRAERPRVAAVNTYGVGGTNAHVVLEEAPARPAPAATTERPRIVVWSARTPEAAERYRTRLAGHFTSAAPDFAASVATLQQGRTTHPYRGAVVATGAREAADLLAAASGPATGPSGSRIALLFPGMGSQHPGMALDLHDRSPAYARAFDACLDLFEAEGVPLRGLWRDADARRIADPDIAQPLLFAVEHALAQAWHAWGVRPGAVLGHSLGELAAAAAAGVLTPEDAVRAVVARSRALAATPPGAMLAVAAAEADVAPLLPDDVHVAVVNGPRMVVVAGPVDAVARAGAELREAGMNVRPVPFSRASHVPLAAPAAEAFEESLRGLRFSAPALDLYSSATGGLVSDAEATDPAFWAGQLVRPVRFADAVAALAGTDGRQLLIECGPGRTLTSALRQHPAVDAARHRVLPTLAQRRTEPLADVQSALTAVAAVWTEGHAIDWTAVEDLSDAGRVPVPGYPYERQRYWVDVAAEEEAQQTPTDSPFRLPSWHEQPRPAHRPEPVARTAVVALPTDETAARRITAALREAGLRVVPLTPGADYEDREVGFVVREGEPQDLARAFRTLRERGVTPGLLVHAGSLGRPEGRDLAEQLAAGHTAATELLRQAAESGAPELVVLTEHAVDVSGHDRLRPGHAALTALAGEAGVRLIDLGGSVPDRELAAELRAGGDDVVALRGTRRWVPTEHPLAVTPAEGPALRPAGTYLITGGTGRLGVRVARGLAATGLHPTLVLVGLKAAERPELLAELASLGATVESAACDVTDHAALTALLDDVTGRHGPVHGVLHLAGPAPDAAEADAFGPRAFGLATLARAFAGRPALDLFATVTRSRPDAADAVLTALAATSAPPAARTLVVSTPRPTDATLLLELLQAHTPTHVTIRHVPDQASQEGQEGRKAEPAPAPPVALPTERDATTARLRELWTGLLGWPEIADGADFFDIGGNSLTAVELVSHIHDEFGVDLGIAALFDYPTLDALAAQIERKKSV
ncbi:type I polyketide synthase [Kitasatospora sp. NPDC059722]|uniref:type I polyketide synthase n=1 Tax=Kitasatospora sp. NPDC059722 TaxID=3346925 RepID=UPI0036AF7DBB